MSRIRFNVLLALRKDRLKAFETAAAKCRKCAHECECDKWIAIHNEGEGASPPDFCPNVHFLRVNSQPARDRAQHAAHDRHELFADLIGLQLDAQERLATSEAALLREREVAQLREQFIAVLGHDLRNPLASINAGAQLLGKTPLNDNGRLIVEDIHNSVRRMARLIDNLLDLARGRLGGGLTLQRSADEPLAPILEHVIAELRVAWPDRAINAEIAVDAPVACDSARIAQLLSNLLANALTHGAEEKAIVVRASVRSGVFELSVANSGDQVPPAVMDRLFQPFFRASKDSGRPGLGLGLYIASEIARGHDGTLDVVSTPDETRFTFRMPAATSAFLRSRRKGRPRRDGPT